MRCRYLPTVAVILLTSFAARSAEPLPPLAPQGPAAPTPPQLLMASASACENAVTLHIRTIELVPVTLDTVSQIPVRETTLVKGKPVERVRLVEDRRPATVLRPAPGRVIEVPVDGEVVSVVDLKGKPVPAARLRLLLKKESAVLVSVTGPVDPYYLQTTRPGTLIVQMPAQLLAAPPIPLVPGGEKLPPPSTITPAANDGEPPLAPARPIRKGD